MKKYSVIMGVAVVMIGLCGMGNSGCDDSTSDRIQSQRQETVLKEGVAHIGNPNIINFREMQLLKDIYELRDQEGLVTYTYIVAENTGKLVFLGESIGYGIPAATQFTSPLRDMFYGTSCGIHFAMPQAEPNGLYSPANAEGTWVMMLNPETHKATPVYIEPRVIVSPFKLQNQ